MINKSTIIKIVDRCVINPSPWDSNPSYWFLECTKCGTTFKIREDVATYCMCPKCGISEHINKIRGVKEPCWRDVMEHERLYGGNKKR